MRKPNYDKFPSISIPASDGTCVAGWPVIGRRLHDAIAARDTATTILAVECYPGIDESALIESLVHELKPSRVIRSADAMLPEDAINRLCEPFLGGDDPVFGFLCGLSLPQFFDPDLISTGRNSIEKADAGIVLVVGVGATLIRGHQCEGSR